MAYYLVSLATTLILSCGMSGEPTFAQSECNDTLQLRCEDGELIELTLADYHLVENQAGYYLTLQNTEKLQRVREVKVTDFRLCVQGKPYLVKAGRAFSATLPEGADFHFATYPNGTMAFSSEGELLIARIDSASVINPHSP